MITKILACHLVRDDREPLKVLMPGEIVRHHLDIDTWGIIIGVTDSSYVTVMWSEEPQDYYLDCDYYSDYDDWDDSVYDYDNDSPWVTTKDIKEIWAEDNRHARRDDARAYGSEKQRMRRSMKRH